MQTKILVHEIHGRFETWNLASGVKACWNLSSELKFNHFRSLIEKLDVEGASKIMEGKSVEELSNLLLSYAYDESEGDIRLSTLMVGLICRDPKWEWHFLASLILCQPPCSLNGAYFAA